MRAGRGVMGDETVVRPGKIVCVGRNYAAHAKELGNAVPERPLLFLKPPSAVIGDGEAIVLPAAAERGGDGAVAGITCANDVTARDLQKTDGQWTRAKGFDTFCPVGPRLVPIDPAGFDFGGLAAGGRGERAGGA